MKGLETGKDKVKKICEVLKKETLEPAKREAEEILQKAHEQAQKIVSEAQAKAQEIEKEAKMDIERQRNVFQSSLNQACKQSLEFLKQEIESNLFNKSLSQVITKHTQDPKVLAELITAVVKAIEKDGLNSDISAYISASVPVSSVNAVLIKDILDRLKEHSVVVGNLQGGACVKLHKENITLDVSDAAIKDLVANYIRKDFRKMLFAVN